VQLLPHGYEGQGPEHSSARVERYLQLCAEHNMQVVNCTTPAQFFHVLRRQIRRDIRKPLVVFTPKSLLRHKLAVSNLEEFGPGTSFHRVLWDDRDKQLVDDDKIKRVVLCTGKVYYDLFEAREEAGIDDVYLLRLEQMYPWPIRSLTAELQRFNHAELIWCQEESKNMGAWSFVDPLIEETLRPLKVEAERPRYVGRPASASPATGSAKRHAEEQKRLVHEALGLDD
jgi:2-oxoglutarate dehydrogenase E1 component